MEGGSATVPINLVCSPFDYISYEGPPTAGTAPLGGGDPEVATGSEPVFASHLSIQSPTVVHKLPQYIFLEESLLPHPQPNPVGPISPPPSPRQKAYIEHVHGISHLIRPSGVGGSGGGHSSRWGGICTCCCTPHTPVLPCGGGLWSLRGQVAAGGGGGGSSPPRGGGCPSFRHSRGPAQAPGEGDLKHTCDCPRCMVHYETCIQSLMAQVQDLRAKGLELQQSQQELSEAVGSTAGISKSYGDRMTQVSSTLAKCDAVVQGYQRDSRAVASSEADHLKMSDSNTAKCFSAVETLAMRYAAVASRIDAWDQGYATPAEAIKVVPPPSSAPHSMHRRCRWPSPRRTTQTHPPGGM